MKHCYWVMLAMALVLSSCGANLEERTKQKMQEMTAMSELGTVEYTVSKVVKCNDKIWYKVGDRKILFTCRAYLKAGLDMAKFSPDCVAINGTAIEITLPAPTLLSLDMPAEDAKLVYEKTGLLRNDFSATERNELLRQGEEAILEDVPNLGILEDAKKSATQFFTAMLKQLGYKTITVKFAEV